MQTTDEATGPWPESAQPGPSRFETGQIIDGRYVVLDVIGAGGMGTVVRVESQDDHKVYALKWCRVAGAGLKRFAREVRLMRKVRHAHVAPILFANLKHDPPYFVMPLAEGSLAAELSSLQGNEAEALGLFRQVCQGVQALHDSGVVHRDLKPANVLRFAGGRVAVADLGLAKLETPDTTMLTQTRAVVGTFAYLAPEQFLPAGSRRADARTDIFQLGKMLYQLVTGNSPLYIEPAALPAGLGHILQRATSANPDDRYQDLGQFLDALRYYELSRDPAANAREALENLVLQAEDVLKTRRPPPELLRELLAVWLGPGRREPGAVLVSFDRIPDGLLPICARDCPVEFLPVLKCYAEALRARVARCQFAYADAVARRMRSVFVNVPSPEVKTVALQALLIAAVELNRFAALGAFNRLLLSIQTLDVALPVAEMLRASPEYYQEVADAIPPGRLHPVLRAFRNEILAGTESPF